MNRDMKVIDKGLQGKDHNTPFVKLFGEDGSTMKIILDSKSQLADYTVEEMLTVRLNKEQTTLET